MKKRITAMLMALVFCLSPLPLPALASEEPEMTMEAEPEDASAEAIFEDVMEPTLADIEASAEDVCEEPVEESEPEPAADGEKWVEVSTKNFPDEAFYAVVSQVIDENHSGWLSESEVAAVTALALDHGSDFPVYLHSLKGIEFFTELEYLSCRNHYTLGTLDVTQNTKLQYLDCGNTGLSALDLSCCPELYMLFCDNNSISELDISSNEYLIETYQDGYVQRNYKVSGVGRIDYGYMLETEDGGEAFVPFLGISMGQKLCMPEEYYIGWCGDEMVFVYEDNVLYFFGEGDMWGDPIRSKWLCVPYDIQAVFFDEGVVSISQGAFTGMKTIREVSLCDTLETIGSAAFSGCSGLEEITIPDSVKKIANDTFRGCAALRTAVIGDGVTEIGQGAFYSCSTLESVFFGSAVANLGTNDIFFSCVSLREFIVSEENESFYAVDGVLYKTANNYLQLYPAGKADKQFSIPDGVKGISSYAFTHCVNLEELTLPASMINISGYAFAGAESLKRIIVDGAEQIGGYWFDRVSNLESVILLPGVKRIGSGSFYMCENLTSITIPKTVTYIDSAAVSGCGLTDVYYEGSIEDWNAIEIYHSYYNDSILRAAIHYGAELTPADADEDGRIDERDAAQFLQEDRAYRAALTLKYAVGLIEG